MTYSITTFLKAVKNDVSGWPAAAAHDISMVTAQL
jgi:hypothetical protein